MANENKASEITPYNPSEENVVVYRTEDKTLELDVQLKDETVWLTQQQMADLFQKDQSVIARHISNIFREGELEKSNMQILHNTMFKYRPTRVYNLDVILSVGYRVNSKRGIMFHRWAILENLIKTATKRVIMIDGYVDATTFDILDVRAKGVSADIYSDSDCKNLRDMHNASVGKL